MKYLFYVLLCFLLAHFQLLAQSAKSVTPLPAEALAKAGASSIAKSTAVTRAVVVGISDYQSAHIPDLQFADRDAEAFAAYLKSPAGGSIPADSILLLTNKNATVARFADALNWLMESTREGDLAIIYFSGHGDVEAKVRNQWGFLLCYDSPEQSYIAGAYPLNYLQDVITTISLDHKARVLIITDACHAGKLAGSRINGAQLTNANLAQQMANEIKIMSCQQQEYSLEGMQWGGGRGVFSWCLVNGMTGLADANLDGTVSLLEIGRYLEEKVPAETAPQQQLPLVSGDRMTRIAQVNNLALETLKKEMAGQPMRLATTGSKGMEEGLLALKDSSVQARYQQFIAAMDQHQLLSPPGICANDLYEALKNEPELASLHNLMRRNLAIALQDEVQQAMNALMDNDPYEANNWYYNPEKYTEYPAQLRRAMELLTEKNRAYKSLKSKLLYFEGYNLLRNSEGMGLQSARDSIRAVAKAKFLESLALEPQAAYVCNAIGNMYFAQTPPQTDSLVFWCTQAQNLSPSWINPLLDMAHEYANSLNDPDKSSVYILKAVELAPESYLVLGHLSWLLQWQGKPEESKAISRKLIELKPDFFNAYETMAHTLYYMDGDVKLAHQFAQEAIDRNKSPENYGYFIYGVTLTALRKPSATIQLFDSLLASPKVPPFAKGTFISVELEACLISGDFSKADTLIQLFFRDNLASPFYQAYVKYLEAQIRLLQNRIPEAILALKDALRIEVPTSPLFPDVYALLGECYARQSKFLEAETYFKQGVELETAYQFERWLFQQQAFFRYGNFLLRQHRLEEARVYFQKAQDKRKFGFLGAYGFALVAAQKGQTKVAFDWLEKALDNWYPDPESIYAEPLFKKIKKTQRFKALITQNFPGFKP